jgi:cytidine deaminase
MDFKDLIEIGKKARENAYAPYSKLRIGSAVLTKNGKVYSGCNVENSVFGLSCCAEQVAIFKAVSDGNKDIITIAVVSDATNPIVPCGACRQVMVEFNQEIKVILATISGKIDVYRVSDLLPESFHFNVDE